MSSKLHDHRVTEEDVDTKYLAVCCVTRVLHIMFYVFTSHHVSKMPICNVCEITNTLHRISSEVKDLAQLWLM